MVLANKVIYQNGAIREFEKPEVCEAIKVANANRWTVGLSPIEWDDREARLKKEHEKHANASDKMGMTLKEAKDILKKEFAVIGIHKSTEPFEFDESRWIEHEKPSVLKAFRVLSKEGYYLTISAHDYNMRQKRLKKEYEENTKAPGPGEEQPKEDNPALKESASQFNDALLDEQGKKIEELTKDKELMKKASLSQLDDFIEIYNLLTKESQKTKRLGKEIAKLNSIIHDKNAVLSDVSEEFRLTKIREKNLTEVCQKYVKENEELKKELADKVVDKIDAQALKSAESALAYKEKVIAEKDDVIADLGKELAAQKDLVDDISLKYDGAKHNLKLRMDECEKLKKQLDSNTKMVQKMAEIIVHKKPVTADVFKKCWIMAYSEEKLSKVLDDVIDQFLLFGEIIIKEEK